MNTLIIAVAVIAFIAGGSIGLVAGVNLAVGKASDIDYENGAERDGKEL